MLFQMDFDKFKRAVAQQFQRMQEYDLFVADVEGDDLWTAYLSSFPEGTNPVYRKRTEHDCSGCRSFIKKAGKIVAIIDGKCETIWDIKSDVDHGYKVVADALAAKVKAVAIDNVFLTSEKTAGADKTFENIVSDVKAWEHFFIRIPAQYIAKIDDIGPKLSETRATHDVMARSLSELTTDAVETVQELIAQNSLYRGEENKFAVDSFAQLQKEFRKLKKSEQDAFVWSEVSTIPTSVARIRNTAIGTLLVSLSEGQEMEAAVRSFEAMVAPANYKRPTALVTKAQVEKAKQTIQDLGLTSALQRRFAVLQDITINNIVFADRNAKKEINGDVFDELVTTTNSKKNFDKVEEIGIEKFLADVLPKANSLEIFVENRHTPNLVSLIAPEDPTAGQLFKWNNHFSWSYNGEMADAIKERVKAAGGSVVGDLCCRLAWEYTDDLDFHCTEPASHGGPGGSYEINYTNRRQKSPNGGTLDLDANGADGLRDDPAENIYYADKRQMRDGIYTLKVHNFNRRSDGKGFVVEIEFDGQTHRIEYDKALRTKEMLEIAKIRLKNGEFSIIESLPSTQTSKEVWGLKTQTFHRANVVMMSPNHWDGHGIGNKHYFFMIDDCQNNGTARGFFNEFLKEELNQHRKVLEMVGSKMKISGNDQLSGLGFSSTARNTLVCRVKGSFTRPLKIVF